MMKKFIAILLTITFCILTLTGCKKSYNEYEIVYSDLMNKELAYNISIVNHSTSEMYTNYDSWASYIAEEFGINIKIHYALIDNFSYLDIKNGLIYFTDLASYVKCVDEGLLLSIDEYSLPKYYAQAHMEIYKIDGKQYGLPAHSMYYEEKARIYLSESLNSEQYKVIDTIDEFYTFAKNYMLVKRPDEKILSINPYEVGQDLYDIQNGFGCYFSTINTGENRFDSSLSFNPNTQTFEDFAFSEDMYHYLSFLKALKTNGILVTSQEHANQGFGQMQSTDITFWGNVFDYMNSDIFTIGSSYLKGSNEQNLYQKRGYPMVYGVATGTDNVQGYIDFISKEYLTDVEFLKAMKAGIPSLDYNSVNENIVVYNLNNTSPNMWVPTSGYIVFSKNSSISSTQLERVKRKALDVNEYKRYCETLEGSEFYPFSFLHSLEYFYGTELLANQKLLNFNTMVLAPILKDEILIDDAIINYRNQAKVSGLYDFIIEINRTVERLPFYNYSD